jgi:hypothetical protein
MSHPEQPTCEKWQKNEIKQFDCLPSIYRVELGMTQSGDVDHIAPPVCVMVKAAK